MAFPAVSSSKLPWTVGPRTPCNAPASYSYAIRSNHRPQATEDAATSTDHRLVDNLVDEVGNKVQWPFFGTIRRSCRKPAKLDIPNDPFSAELDVRAENEPNGDAKWPFFSITNSSCQKRAGCEYVMRALTPRTKRQPCQVHMATGLRHTAEGHAAANPRGRKHDSDEQKETDGPAKDRAAALEHTVIIDSGHRSKR